MNTLLKRTAIIFTLLFIVQACVTINVYFPAAAVGEAADSIVEEVWGEEEAAPEEPPIEGEPQSFIDQLMRSVFTVFGPEEVFAAEADINVTTPAIRALKGSIADRASSIKPYMDSGNVGITNNGLLAVRSTDGLNLKKKAELKRLIDAENKDRKALYSEIAKANNFPPDKVSDIQEIFAKSWIKQAKTGWAVQTSDGTWGKKK